MEALELTSEQKARLLEMCGVLFPEDVFSFNNDDGDDGIIDRNFAGYNIPEGKELSWKDKGSHFHWFEFVILHLAPKLDYYPWKIAPHLEFLDEGNENYIIDFLYEQFKKL